MTFSLYNNAVKAYWYGRPLVAREAFSQMAEFFRTLKKADEIFSALYLGDAANNRFLPVSDDLSDFSMQAAACIDPETGYRNADPNDKSFSMESFCRIGFRASLATTETSRASGAWVSIKCGQEERDYVVAPNKVDINLSPELGTPERFHTLFRETVRFWQPDDAVVSQPKVASRFSSPVGMIDPGWLTYLRGQSAVRALPAGFAYERFEGGIIIRAADRPGAPDDEEYIGRLLALRDALQPEGFLDNPNPHTRASRSPSEQAHTTS